jgi:phage terminase large subunit-like protein
MLSDVEGALWTIELIEKSRQDVFPVGAPLRVVGVDPSVAENPRDECGIVVCASTADHDLYKRQAWVMEDATIHGSPEVWANAVVAMARKYGCPVVAEVNQGVHLFAMRLTQLIPTSKYLKYTQNTVKPYVQNQLRWRMSKDVFTTSTIYLTLNPKCARGFQVKVSRQTESMRSFML